MIGKDGSVDFQQPLLKFSSDPADWWRVRDAFEGVQIFGGIGSGKTSGSGKSIAKAFLQNGFGGLVHCAKPEEKDTWLRYAKETGRLDDVVIFEEGSDYYFNPLQYELTREGKGAGEVFNLSNLFMEIYKMGNRFTGGGGGDKDRYWDNALKRSLNRMILLLILSGRDLTIANMIEIMASVPGEDFAEEEESFSLDEWTDWYNKSFCVECVYDIYNQVESWKNEIANLEDESFLSREDEVRLAELRETLPSLEDNYNTLRSYFYKQFARADEKTRSIVRESFLGLAEPFTMGVLKKHFAGGLTILPEWSYEGKIIILNFSVKEYLDSGMYAQGIFKYLWQQAIERRDTKKHPLPCFLWVDESQYFVNEYDTIFQTTARSSRAATVFLTQNISNYYAQMGGKSAMSKVDSLLGNLSTKIFHANNDAVTNEWASKAIGQGIITLEGESENRKNFHILADTKGISRTPHILPQVLPKEFTTLLSGGKNEDPDLNFIVQAIMIVKGHVWPKKMNYRMVEFEQI